MKESPELSSKVRGLSELHRDHSLKHVLPPIRGGEEVSHIIVLDARMEHEDLVCKEQNILVPKPPSDAKNLYRLLFSPTSAPSGYVPIGGGVAYAYQGATVQEPFPGYSEVDHVMNPHGNSWYSENLPIADDDGLEVIMIVPNGYTLTGFVPLPKGAKAFNDRLAVHWHLRKGDQPLVKWKVTPLTGDVQSEVIRINNATESMPGPADFQRAPSNPNPVADRPVPEPVGQPGLRSLFVAGSFFLVTIVVLGLLFLFIGNTASNPYVLSTTYVVIILAFIVVAVFVLAFLGVIDSGTLERMVGKIIGALPMLKRGGSRSPSGSDVNAGDGDGTRV